MLYLESGPRSQRARNSATRRRGQVNLTSLHGVRDNAATLTEVDVLLEFARRPVQSVGMPSEDRVYPWCGRAPRLAVDERRAGPQRRWRIYVRRRRAPLRALTNARCHTCRMGDLPGLIGAERLALIDFLETLAPEEWATPSPCGAWTVQDVAAHLAWAPSGSVATRDDPRAHQGLLPSQQGQR